MTQTHFHRLCFLFTTILLVASSAPVQATIVQRDLVAAGDKLATVDTSSGLEWLDVSATTGLSFNEVVADTGGWASMGFVHADEAQMHNLYSEFGITDLSTVFVGANVPGVPNLVNAMGATLGTTFQGGWFDSPGGAAPVGLAQVASFGATGSARIVPHAAQKDTTGPGQGNYLVRPASGLTVVDVVYSDPAPPTGPISLGLGSLPDEIPARFVLEGVAPNGVTTFDLDDVLFGEITIGDGTWDTSDLVSFSMTVDFNIIAIIIGLQYEFAGINTPTVTDGGILNNTFSLTVQGTDISSGQDFDYLYQESAQSMQTLTVIPEPSTFALGVFGSLSLGFVGWRRRSR